MESVTYETLVPRLVEAVPEVPLDPNFVADNLPYLVFNDLLRYVIASMGAEEDTGLLSRIFSFIEAAAQTQDIQVHDMLQDALYHIAVAPTEKAESAKLYMGTNTQQLFRKLELQIYQK
jgi:hypothetical protein